MSTQIQSLIEHGRSLVAETMIDTGIITRPSTEAAAVNTTTGRLTPPSATIVGSGPCRVKVASAQEQTALFGDVQVTTQRFVISFAHDLAPVQLGDNVEVSSTVDLSLPDRRFRVVAVESKSVLHSRRLGCETLEDGR